MQLTSSSNSFSIWRRSGALIQFPNFLFFHFYFATIPDKLRTLLPKSPL
jgi:hypothetical protein